MQCQNHIYSLHVKNQGCLCSPCLRGRTLTEAPGQAWVGAPSSPPTWTQGPDLWGSTGTLDVAGMAASISHPHSPGSP